MRLDELPIQVINGIWGCKQDLSKAKTGLFLLHYITVASSKCAVSTVVKGGNFFFFKPPTIKREVVKWNKFEQAPGVGDGQGSLVCCSPWGRKESDRTEQLNWSELNEVWYIQQWPLMHENYMMYRERSLKIYRNKTIQWPRKDRIAFIEYSWVPKKGCMHTSIYTLHIFSYEEKIFEHDIPEPVNSG